MRYKPETPEEIKDFEDLYCQNCVDFNKDKDLCCIYIMGMLSKINCPTFPSQWQIDSGIPKCTAYNPRS